MRHPTFPAIFALLLSACAASEGGPDAATGSDAGDAVDAGAPFDAGSEPFDAGPTCDDPRPADAIFRDGTEQATLRARNTESCERAYVLETTQPLRDQLPRRREVFEQPDRPRLRTGTALLDGLYALALDEVRENSVARVSDGNFANNAPQPCPAGGCFQTGRLWTYVWTRDISFSVALGLGTLDPQRARNSLEFKLSERREGGDLQVVQDTGTGGAWPVSTDRVVWALGASALLPWLDVEDRTAFRDRAFEALRNTLAMDRAVVFDPADSLYRGETSFLDWREQTYPQWFQRDLAHVAMSKSLSTNVLHLLAHRNLAALARERGDSDLADELDARAQSLGAAIHRGFWLDDVHGWSAFLTTALDASPVRRFDQLGTALAILAGLGEPAQRRDALSSYPHLPKGAPVTWPFQQGVAPYHNRTQWPFVTAYWAKAARAAGHPEAFVRAANSLVRGAALNLGNMENFEATTGLPERTEGSIRVPLVNSQRQLWSVAGFVSFVHEGLLGLETSTTGLRFRPWLPAALQSGLLAGARTITFEGLSFHGKRIDVRIELPEAGSNDAVLEPASVSLDGQPIGDAFTPDDALRDGSLFTLLLERRPAPASTVRDVDPAADFKQLYGPKDPPAPEPSIESGRIRLALPNGAEAASDVTISIHRDGRRVAANLPGDTRTWTDDTADVRETHCYAVEHTFIASGNASQHSPPRCSWGPRFERVQEWTLRDVENEGGVKTDQLGRPRVEQWGDPSHRLVQPEFRANASGRHLVQLVAARTGNLTTGLTAAVKRVTIDEVGTGAIVGQGYIVAPHTDGWFNWRDTTLVPATLVAGRRYRIVIDADANAVNMSAFKLAERYTGNGGDGGASGASGRVNVATVKVLGFDAFPSSAASYAFDGDRDYDKLPAAQQSTPGLRYSNPPTSEFDAFALDWDADRLFVAVVLARAQQDELLPYMLYLQSIDGLDVGTGTRTGLRYYDQVSELPFNATHLATLRRKADNADGNGPWNGLFRFDGAAWTRQYRFTPDRDAFANTDQVTLSFVVPRAQLGNPTRLRFAGHAVTGPSNGVPRWNVVVPSNHTPWQSGSTGYFEVELDGPHGSARWTRR